MIPNPHISNNTNERLKVFQFATLNIWIKKECIISCLNLLLYCNATENLQNLLMLRTGTISDDVIQKIERTLNNTDTTIEKRNKNGFRKSKTTANHIARMCSAWMTHAQSHASFTNGRGTKWPKTRRAVLLFVLWTKTTTERFLLKLCQRKGN